MLEEKTKQLKSNVFPLCTLSATPKTQAQIKRFEGSRFGFTNTPHLEWT